MELILRGRNRLAWLECSIVVTPWKYEQANHVEHLQYSLLGDIYSPQINELNARDPKSPFSLAPIQVLEQFTPYS
jgi:hypothetical protein